MIEAAHAHFIRWAQWVLAPVPGDNLGYGKNILQRIREGKGTLLPGPTSRGKIHTDPVALVVDAYVKRLDRPSRVLIRTFYLNPYWTVEEKAKRLKMPTRTVYDHLDRIHRHFETQQHSDGV